MFPLQLFTRSFLSFHIRYKSLSVKLLLIRLHVDVALQLRAGGSELEAKVAALGLLVHLNQAAHAAVLEGVLETSSEVGEELVDRSNISVSIPVSAKHAVKTYPRCATAPETP